MPRSRRSNPAAGIVLRTGALTLVFGGVALVLHAKHDRDETSSAFQRKAQHLASERAEVRREVSSSAIGLERQSREARPLSPLREATNVKSTTPVSKAVLATPPRQPFFVAWEHDSLVVTQALSTQSPLSPAQPRSAIADFPFGEDIAEPAGSSAKESYPEGVQAGAITPIAASLFVPLENKGPMAKQAAVTSEATVSVDDIPHAATQDRNADLQRGVPSPILRLIAKHSKATGIEERWLLAMLHAENAAFDRAAVSPAGAIGLMQVMPAIGKAYGAKDLFDPDDNLRVASLFLRDLFDKYGNPVAVIAAYNAGEPKIDAKAGIPVIPETVDYVSRVTSFYYTGDRDNLHPLRRPRLAAEADASLVTGAITGASRTRKAQAMPASAMPRGMRRMSRAERIRQDSTILNSID